MAMRSSIDATFVSKVNCRVQTPKTHKNGDDSRCFPGFGNAGSKIILDHLGKSLKQNS